MRDPECVAVARKRLGMCEVVVGDVYRHHEGEYYTVLAVSVDHTLTVLVTYQSEVDWIPWTLDYSDFVGTVWIPTGKGDEAYAVPRFTRVAE